MESEILWWAKKPRDRYTCNKRTEPFQRLPLPCLRITMVTDVFVFICIDHLGLFLAVDFKVYRTYVSVKAICIVWSRFGIIYTWWFTEIMQNEQISQSETKQVNLSNSVSIVETLHWWSGGGSYKCHSHLSFCRVYFCWDTWVKFKPFHFQLYLFSLASYHDIQRSINRLF